MINFKIQDSNFKIIAVLTLCSMLFALCLSLPAIAEDDLAKKMSGVLMKAPEDGGWQVTSDEVYMWIKTGKTDFMILDVRPGVDEFNEGHIPAAVHMPYYTVLNPENLSRLPKDKKLVLACATGQLENLPVVGLRMLGYDAYTLLFGYASWIKGYAGGEAMTGTINKAAAKNYPIEQTGGSAK
ncbi:MAG: rhodanese-like domain-containing protein [Nitrospirae bacterium]|nr:rhodanese-like domain-containing protein [Nitrospirota bacterium]